MSDGSVVELTSKLTPNMKSNREYGGKYEKENLRNTIKTLNYDP